ncbi:hypothetical protein BpHYR1_025534 [Brachionus plicatilis]|uniref:Uncharacterized protein n=1 Tax=Brachionus plicatilis TaxID=10195 RepID=A0A3M7SBU9_BRAPC|nr:hypothetical protein BpHYR1_025534 [Brachionus plicatilis]
MKYRNFKFKILCAEKNKYFAAMFLDILLDDSLKDFKNFFMKHCTKNIRKYKNKKKPGDYS